MNANVPLLSDQIWNRCQPGPTMPAGDFPPLFPADSFPLPDSRLWALPLQQAEAPASGLPGGAGTADGSLQDLLIASLYSYPPPPRYLRWEERASRIPGSRCRLYLAKIEGPDDRYRFDRHFLRGTYQYYPDEIYLTCEIESTGVYEVGTSWIDGHGVVFLRQREWFLLVGGDAYDLQDQDVLHAVDALRQASPLPSITPEGILSCPPNP